MVNQHFIDKFLSWESLIKDGARLREGPHFQVECPVQKNKIAYCPRPPKRKID